MFCPLCMDVRSLSTLFGPLTGRLPTPKLSYNKLINPIWSSAHSHYVRRPCFPHCRFSTIHTPNVQSIRANMAADHQVSAANKRLAQQLSNRPGISQNQANAMMYGNNPGRPNSRGRRGGPQVGGAPIQQRVGNGASNIKARLSMPRGRGGNQMNFNLNNNNRGGGGGSFRGANRGFVARGDFNRGRGGMTRGGRGGQQQMNRSTGQFFDASRGRGRGGSFNNNRGGQMNNQRGGQMNSQRGGVNRGRGGRGRGFNRGGRGGRGGANNRGGASVEDLDSQLDQYMSKSKSALDSELDVYMSQM